MQNSPEKKIATFLLNQTVLTLAVSENSSLYCCMCYYVYHPEENILVFKSKESTKHIQMALEQTKVAGAIRQDVLDKTHIQGVQFNGEVLIEPEENLHKRAKKAYYDKYPFAKVIAGTVWVIKLDYMKLTENRIGIMSHKEWSAAV
ncbi:hypothetical protein C3K47_16265 [Solitalea longa]|uniref:Pyridoxamine 5'-phosphate oxidase putative domain-containing protein n=1 Tax=Solitalea longa TaxID=2079460 RepID=A0A2S4ZXW9_9SPHI|nr:hypothetical protein [Solitalea longa]POY35136.1 hypothetical protein C3K47_16265 [Solitalea longa]